MGHHTFKIDQPPNSKWTVHPQRGRVQSSGYLSAADALVALVESFDEGVKLQFVQAVPADTGYVVIAVAVKGSHAPVIT
jgi:hypothetical protein